MASTEADPTVNSSARAKPADSFAVPKKKRQILAPKFIGVDGKSKLKLAKPLTKKARRIISNKTHKMMRRREKIDKELLEEVQRENVTAQHWLARETLLRRQEQLEKREKRHIARRTMALLQRERLYRWDPTTERAADLDLIRKLLWKFKRHLGPMLEYHGNLEPEADDDDSSGEEWEDEDAAVVERELDDSDEGGERPEERNSSEELSKSSGMINGEPGPATRPGKRKREESQAVEHPAKNIKMKKYAASESDAAGEDRPEQVLGVKVLKDKKLKKSRREERLSAEPKSAGEGQLEEGLQTMVERKGKKEKKSKRSIAATSEASAADHSEETNKRKTAEAPARQQSTDESSRLYHERRIMAMIQNPNYDDCVESTASNNEKRIATETYCMSGALQIDQVEDDTDVKTRDRLASAGPQKKQKANHRRERKTAISDMDQTQRQRDSNSNIDKSDFRSEASVDNAMERTPTAKGSLVAEGSADSSQKSKNFAHPKKPSIRPDAVRTPNPMAQNAGVRSLDKVSRDSPGKNTARWLSPTSRKSSLPMFSTIPLGKQE
jgi:hypothetical protein